MTAYEFTELAKMANIEVVTQRPMTHQFPGECILYYKTRDGESDYYHDDTQPSRVPRADLNGLDVIGLTCRIRPQGTTVTAFVDYDDAMRVLGGAE